MPGIVKVGVLLVPKVGKEKEKEKEEEEEKEQDKAEENRRVLD